MPASAAALMPLEQFPGVAGRGVHDHRGAISSRLDVLHLLGEGAHATLHDANLIPLCGRDRAVVRAATSEEDGLVGDEGGLGRDRGGVAARAGG